MNGADKKSFSAGQRWPRVLVFGIGDGGLRIVESMVGAVPVGVELAALASDGEALRRSRVARKSRLGERLERALVSALFEDFEAVILVVDLGEETVREVVVELARIAVRLKLLALAAVRSPRHPEASRTRAGDVVGELAAQVHAQFETGLGRAQDAEASLREEVIACAWLVAEGLRQGTGPKLPQRWYTGAAGRPTRGGPTRGGLGMDNEAKEESILLGGGSQDEVPRMEPPFDLSVEEPPAGAPAAPVSSLPAAPTVDPVDFTVTAPKSVTPGQGFVLKLWAHLGEQLEQVLKRAGSDVSSETQGSVELARGTELVFELKIDDFTIDEPQARLRWLGTIGNVSFAVTVPAGRKPGSVLGKATIHAAGIHVMTLNFQLQVGKAKTEVAALPAWEIRFRSAFASYSSKDRDEVLGRIQGMKKIAPDLDVFLDRALLRSGDYWAKRLHEEIERRDIFFLFWSENAKASEWVEKEWRLALETRGLDFIDPVPLVSPEQAPPPKELSDKHFYDWELAFRRVPPPA